MTFGQFFDLHPIVGCTIIAAIVISVVVTIYALTLSLKDSDKLGKAIFKIFSLFVLFWHLSVIVVAGWERIDYLCQSPSVLGVLLFFVCLPISMSVAILGFALIDKKG